MSFDIAVVISVLALAATVYQLYLQRVHNEKSVKPLGQIDLIDFDRKISIYIVNNGLGPLILERMIFSKDGQTYTRIDDCLALDSKSYSRIHVSEKVKRVVLPNKYLTAFETIFSTDENEMEVEKVRAQLSSISLKVEGRDIYDNLITIERDLEWFSRHMLDKSQPS
ncbi:hypothetical protein [Siphonobacter sp. SORGH_AS_1065]|uniref:hypothetical protein n=1 Tax=Siphonobacter sp. SORGH_AS_1065 TaxID=3041795 RepID=UPI0027870D1D|nr:hypothetical protein [Siphonobacter sp. SORGH_AS_1065]MDQ1086154.1 hypothetical protein [Siphonobacter sp. SORGH_AS_1065]